MKKRKTRDIEKIYSNSIIIIIGKPILFSLILAVLAGAMFLAPADALAANITISDLGIADVGILPTSRWYFFREWGRGISRIFTFNSVKKADLELRITNEKAAEILAVQEKEPQKAEALEKALANYQKAQERLAAQLEALKETSQNPNVDQLLDKLVGLSVKHIEIFDRLEAEGKDTLKTAINTAKSNTFKVTHTASGKDESEKFAEKIKNAVEKLPGDELKHIRSVEIVEQFADKAPEEVKKSLEKVRWDFSEKLEEDFTKYKDDDKPDSVTIKGKIEALPGDAARHLIIFDEIRQRADKRTAETISQVSKDLEKTIVGGDDIKQKAEEQIKRAEAVINELEEKSAGIAITDPDAPPERTAAGAGKKDEVVQRVKNLLAQAQSHLAKAKQGFAEGKYGEAFGQARAAEVAARNGLRMIIEIDGKPTREAVSVPPAVVGPTSLQPERCEIIQKEISNLKSRLVSGELTEEQYREKLDNLQKEYEKICARPVPVPAPAIEQATPSPRPMLSRCEELKKSLAELDELLKAGRISAEDYKLKYESIKKELAVCERAISPTPAPTYPVAPKPIPQPSEITKPIEGILCTQEWNPVCGEDGKTYSNECMAKVAGVAVKYKGECQTLTPTTVAPPATIIPPPAPTAVTPTAYEFKLEADDFGFYPDSTITVPKGSRVKIHFIVRTTNVYYGGLDFRSSKFKTESVKPGGITSVEFIADESFVFTSYWPLSNIQKASGRVIVQ